MCLNKNRILVEMAVKIHYKHTHNKIHIESSSAKANDVLSARYVFQTRSRVKLHQQVSLDLRDGISVVAT